MPTTDAADPGGLRSVPADLGAALPGRGLVDRRHARLDGRRRPRRHGRRRRSTCARRSGRGRAPSPTSTGPPARSPAALHARGRRARRRRRAPAPQLGRGRHHLLGRRLPGGGGRADRPLLRAQGGRLHPPAVAARRRRHRRPLRPHRPPRDLRRAPGRAPGAHAGWSSATRRPPPCPPGALPFDGLLDGDPLAAPLAVDPDRPRSSASPRARPATRRASSTRTTPSASRPASSTTCSRRAGRPQITGAPVGHFIGMLNAFLVPLLRDRPVNLVDVWDPGEVLRLMVEEGLGIGGGATYFLTSLLDHPDFTEEHLALHARSPASAARRCPRPSPGGRPGSGSRCSAPTAAPSTRRSRAA